MQYTQPIVTNTPTEHRRLLLSCERFVFLKNFPIHGTDIFARAKILIIFWDCNIYYKIFVQFFVYMIIIL